MNCKPLACVEEERVMANVNLIELSKNFAVAVMKICKTIKTERGETVLYAQLLRSGTSIGANIHEGNYASSRSDFINKFQIALKECNETLYWLEIFLRAEYLQEIEYKDLYAACSKIKKLLSSSLLTAKQSL